MKFESESKRKIKELEFRQATVRLNKAKRKLELKPALNNYDMMILQIRVQQRENEIRDGKAAVKMLKMSSPLDGIFQIKRNYNGQLVKIGDNVYSNNLIASIPDISKMKVKTYVNEADITKIKPTTKVLIRLDAMPSVIFNGSVSYISKVCIPRENEKVFTVNLEVAESDIRLKPGMTVSCEYLCNESGDQLYVPNNCLYRENGKSFIFLKKGGSSKKVEVKAGASNANHTLIAGDFKPGQKLIPVEKIEEIN
jgi:HlyD family secretion protein